MDKDFKISSPCNVCLCCSVSKNICSEFSCRPETEVDKQRYRIPVAKLHFHHFKNTDTNCPNGATSKCVCPDSAPRYSGYLCEKNDRMIRKQSRCPVRAYPLSCSESGSPCMKCCNCPPCRPIKREVKKPLKYGDYGTEGYLCTQVCGEYMGKKKSKVLDSSKPYYSSCFRGSSRDNGKKLEREIESSCCEFDGDDEFRKGGVIPSYMGHVPGLHFTFGSCYGLTANRLLARHFNEMESRDC